MKKTLEEVQALASKGPDSVVLEDGFEWKFDNKYKIALNRHTMSNFQPLLDVLHKISDPTFLVPFDGRCLERYYEDIAYEAIKAASEVEVGG